MNALVFASAADVFNIHEGRGYGEAGYYWPTQNALLYHHLLKEGLQNNGSSLDMWLNFEAFESLQDNPCLPASGSGISLTMDRVTKGRLDMALSAGAAFVQKVSVSAWDPDFTCIPKNNLSSTLTKQVYNDADRPIIAHCSFNSQVTWSDIKHTLHHSYVYGSCFETDFGYERHLVRSLYYAELFDPYNIMQLNPKGTVRVKAKWAYRACVFTYDYTKVDNETGGKSKGQRP